MNKVHRSIVVCALLTALGGSAFGWGNLTHVSLSRQLGVPIGALNMNEMYGAVLPDMANFDFSDEGQAMAQALHFNTDLMMGLYMGAPTLEAKSVFYGVFTHNNVYGADYTAHDNGRTVGNKGWVIVEAERLAPALVPYLIRILTRAGADGVTAASLASGLAPVMAHDLIETAVDVHVRRSVDPLAGARLYLAARYRAPETPLMLADAFNVSPDDMTAWENEYRDMMMQYGQMFMLPERQLLRTLGAVSAELATMFIRVGIPDVPGMDKNLIAVDPERVVYFLSKAIKQVAPSYRRELDLTLRYVRQQLLAHGIVSAAGPCLLAKGDPEFDLENPEIMAVAPAEFALDQNYPNPFNPSTTIRYTLPHKTQISLVVFNALGQEVATLVQGEQDAGRHEVVFDGAGLASGLYLCRMSAGEFAQTIKLYLVR